MSKFPTGFATSNRRVKPLPMGMASFSIPTVTGRMDIASVGSMTKSSALPTGKLHRLLQLENLRQKRSGDREPQQTDYPRTRPDLPNHEPRGCPRGASYSGIFTAPTA